MFWRTITYTDRCIALKKQDRRVRNHGLRFWAVLPCLEPRLHPLVRDFHSRVRERNEFANGLSQKRKWCL
jgi:hypothetical protein